MQRSRLLTLVLLLLTFAVYAPSMANDFAMDDIPLVRSTRLQGQPSEAIATFHAPWWYFGQRYWGGEASNSVLYRPVTVMSYAWTYQLFGSWLPPDSEGLPQHLVNILLNCLAVWLVLLFLKDLGQSDLVAFVCAGLFGLHALHSEVVAGIVGRAELFSFCFGLWAMLQFGRQRPMLAGILLFLAFSSKESALAWAPFLPCYLLAKSWLQKGPTPVVATLRSHSRSMLIAVVPAAVTFLALRYLTVAGTPPHDFSYAQNPLAHVDTLTRLCTAVKLLGYGLYNCFVPFWLYALYGPGALDLSSPSDPLFWVALLILSAWLTLGLLWARRQPILFLSVAAFLGFSFITSNIPLVIGTIFGERLFYMPSLGVCLLPALLLPKLKGNALRVTLTVLGAWTLASCAVIVARNGAWQDSETLFVGDAERLPTSADLQAKAGYMFVDQDPQKAKTYFERSVAIEVNMAGAWTSLGNIHRDQGELDKALRYYAKALATKHVRASGVEGYTIDQYLLLLERLGRNRELFAFAEQRITQNPEHYLLRAKLIEHGWNKLPTRKLSELADEGIQRMPNNPTFALQKTMLMCRTQGTAWLQLNARQVVERLNAILNALPADQRHQPQQVRGYVWIARAMASDGAKPDARRIYQQILSLKGLADWQRQQVQKERDALKD